MIDLIELIENGSDGHGHRHGYGENARGAQFESDIARLSVAVLSALTYFVCG
jgi:hypothetical protein